MSVFDRYYKRYDSWYDKNKFAYLSELAAIRKVLPDKGAGLEIGVGTGRFAAALGIKSGIDPSKNMVKAARKRGIDARRGLGEHLPFKNSVFDHVSIIITLCFTKDPLRVLKEAKRVLKKNGKIIIGIVDKDSFLGRFYLKKKSVFYKNARFFTVKDAAELLRRAGFNKLTYWQTVFTLPADMRSVHKARKGFGKGGFAVISGRRRNEAISLLT
ncbi:MAG: class I SAM-dependent methyltransferase [Candidatus Omnitrophica bacterium]|nr:class I SAM-dependent methyltransferase [Candidatus Omnitrophota bacterium]